MTFSSSTQPSRGLQILKVALYILAALILVPGLITGVSLMISASAMIENILLPLQLIGGEILHNMLAPTLTGFLFNLGIVIIILSLFLSGLLVAVALLIGHIAQLEARLAYLEARVDEPT